MPLLGIPVVEPAKPVIFPSVAPWQSIQVLGLPNTGWLKRLKASSRNSALKDSLMGIVLETEPLSQKPRGPRKVLRPTLPPVPQAGRENGPAVGRGSVQVSVPTVSDAVG